jgi:DNA repair protein RadD
MILRPYQADAIDGIYDYFAVKAGHPIVVIPTAGGKSLVMAAFIRGVLQQWPDQRIVVVTHVKELITQNYSELMSIWPEAPAGIYSAGLGRRQIMARVLFAGIQSIHRLAYAVQQADIVLVDEAHLIPRKSDTMYRGFLKVLAGINPRLKIIGFTATPFRLDSGMLHEGKHALFTDIAFEVSVRELIDQGFLCPLISKSAVTELDVTGVGTSGGEFISSQLQSAVDREEVTRAAVQELVAYGAPRKSWLVFCSGVEHARHVAQAIQAHGITCATVFGNTPAHERDRIIASFKRGEIRALASMGVLTTGFNAPCVDLIAMLRPTKSAGLYIQMAGRGTRLAPEKTDCLVLDFAGNIKRHGPIDEVKPRAPSAGSGAAPIQACPVCGTHTGAAARICPHCGHKFPPPSVTINPAASELPVMSAAAPERLRVSRVLYSRHEKQGGLPSLRVDYDCGLHRHREWVCFEHDGFPRQKAASWWRHRAPGRPVPATVDEALAQAKHLRVPVEIAVRPDGQYMEVVGARFA